MADRIVVLDQGQIQQIGSPEQLYQQPSNLFVARFMGSPTMNTFKLALRDDRVAFAGRGWQVDVPYPETMVWAGLRTEHIQVGHGPEGCGAFQAQLRRQELLGHVRLLYLDSPYGPLQIFHDTQSQPLTDGQDVDCYFMPEQIHLFSATTSERMTIRKFL